MSKKDGVLKSRLVHRVDGIRLILLLQLNIVLKKKINAREWFHSNDLTFTIISSSVKKKTSAKLYGMSQNITKTLNCVHRLIKIAIGTMCYKMRYISIADAYYSTHSVISCFKENKYLIELTEFRSFSSFRPLLKNYFFIKILL